MNTPFSKASSLYIYGLISVTLVVSTSTNLPYSFFFFFFEIFVSKMDSLESNLSMAFFISSCDTLSLNSALKSAVSISAIAGFESSGICRNFLIFIPVHITAFNLSSASFEDIWLASFNSISIYSPSPDTPILKGAPKDII